MKLCSACLLGLKTRYNGEAKNKEKINKLLRNTKLIPVCPEQLGGLPTPREPAEPTKDGKKIIKDKGKVITKSGKNQTPKFIKGAKETLKIAKKLEIKEAILKQRSPSCGNGEIYDGTFTNTTKKGDGVTTALLKQNNIEVISEEDL